MKSHVGFDNVCAKLILNQYKVDSGIKNTTLKAGNKTTEISHVNRSINQILQLLTFTLPSEIYDECKAKIQKN